MHTFLTFPRILAGVVGLWMVTLIVPQPAQAGGVHVSIGVGIPLPVIVAPPPAVIVEPYPVIVQPAPVLVAPPYLGPRPYEQGHYVHWKRHHNEPHGYYRHHDRGYYRHHDRGYYRHHDRGHHRHHRRHHDHD